jgi:hypothetical protein
MLADMLPPGSPPHHSPTRTPFPPQNTPSLSLGPSDHTTDTEPPTPPHSEYDFPIVGSPSSEPEERELLEHIDQRIKLAARAAVRELLMASMDDLD